MKEHGIPMSADMVRATLADLKHQTRRPMDPQPPEWINEFGYTTFTPPGHISGRGYWQGVPGDEGPGEKFFKCKYGQPGDRLWVRETWRIGAWRENDGRMAIDYRATPEIVRTPWVTIPNDPHGDKFNRVWKKVCDELHRKGIPFDEDGQYHWEPGKAPLNWRPSIHMPRWASRITREIVNIRVERVQDITEEDALAEGVSNEMDIVWQSGDDTPVGLFGELWDSIYEKQGFGWDANPWVWVIDFRKIAG